MEHEKNTECDIESMEWGELASIIEAAILDVLAETTNPPAAPTSSPPPPPFPVPTGLEQHTQAQPVESEGNGGCLHQGAVLHTMTVPNTYHGPQCHEDTIYSGPWYDHAGAYDQGQVRY